MAKLSVVLARTASTTLSVGSVNAPATSMRRFKISDILFSAAEATPADNGFVWELQRCTSAGTATAVTPVSLDPGDTLFVTTAGQNHTVDPTLTAGTVLMSEGLNQRAAFRFVCQPGFEIVVPATASNGVALRTPTASAVACRGTLYIEEM